MARRIWITSFVLILIVSAYVVMQFTGVKEHTELFVCPGCKYTVLKLISSAKEKIYCEMYILTNEEYLKALGEARKRGVEILLLLDNNTYNQKTASKLNALGISYKLSDKFHLMHSKACVFDDVLFVGSHNWSYTSESKNREINLLTNSPQAVSEFLNVFWSDWYES